MFADDMKIWNVIRDPADEDRLQMNLNRLEEWSNRWLLRFNVAKCSILRLGNTARSASTRDYFLGGAALKEVEAPKDLGVLTTSSLKPSAHCSRVAKTAMPVLSSLPLIDTLTPRDRSYATRNSCMVIPPPLCATSKRSLFFASKYAFLSNNLPPELKLSPKLLVFKSKLRKHLTPESINALLTVSSPNTQILDFEKGPPGI
nr:unnamed protein product [Spirometra erinaceieuropaei]